MKAGTAAFQLPPLFWVEIVLPPQSYAHLGIPGLLRASSLWNGSWVGLAGHGLLGALLSGILRR